MAIFNPKASINNPKKLNLKRRDIVIVITSNADLRTSRNILWQRRQQTPCILPRVLRHQRINDNQRSHSLNNGNSSWHNARIMSTFGLEHTSSQIVLRGFLRLPDSRRRLERDAEVDRCAVRNTTLNTAGVVGAGCQALLGSGSSAGAGLNLRGDEGVVMDRAGDFAAAEAGADFEALGRGDGEHGVPELGLKLVEAGLAKSDRDIADDAGDCTTDAVVVVAVFLDDLGHARGGFFAGAAGGRERVDGLAVDGFQEVEEFRVCGSSGVLGGRGDKVLVTDGGDERDNLNAVRKTQVLLSDSTSGNTTNCLTGTAATTTAASLDTVLLEVSQICVARTRVQVHRAATVVLRSLVLVADHHANRCSQSDSEFRSRLDLDAVLFVSRGRQRALTGASTGHLGLDVVFCELHAGGAAVNDAANGAAMGFAITVSSQLSFALLVEA